MDADHYEIKHLTEEHLQKLAEQPNTIVYQFAHDEAGKGMLADEARDHIRQIRSRYLQLKSEHPDWSDDSLRERLCAERLAWYRFAKNYRLVFGHATTAQTTDSGMKHCYHLLFIMKQYEEGILTLEQSRAQVLQYGKEHFSLSKA